MILALTQTGNYLLANDPQAKEYKNLRCPSCKRRVFLKHGKRKISHFSHHAKEACNVFSEGETLEHITGKLHIFNYLKEKGYHVELEAYLKELKQRPDILLIINNQKIAIEFQCSFLSIERMIDRTNNYYKHGYEVYWILGEKLRPDSRITVLHNCFIQYHKLFSFYLLIYSVKDRKLQIIYNIQNTFHRKWHFDRVTINKTVLLDLLEDKNVKISIHKENETYNLEEIHSALMKSVYRADSKLKFFCHRLYIDGQTVQSMPLELYMPVKNEWLMETNSFLWKYLLLDWVENHQKGKVITRKMIDSLLDKFIVEKQIVLTRMPMVKKEHYQKVFYAFMDKLSEYDILKKIRKEKWSVNKKATRFKNEEEKMMTLQKVLLKK